MKISFTIIICLILHTSCYSQVDYSKDWVNSGWEYSNETDSIIDVTERVISKNDLSYLLKGTYPSSSSTEDVIPLFGLLGENFDKIEFVFTDITRTQKEISQYMVHGKTRIQNNTIQELEGFITFQNATAYISESEMEQTIVVLTGTYTFKEYANKNHTATNIGTLKMVLSTPNIAANDIDFDMDMYYEDGAVRGFVGVRSSLDDGTSQICIWGFSRFRYEYAKNFDVGYGEEKINVKYARSWFDYTDLEWEKIVSTNPNGIFTNEDAYNTPAEATWFKFDEKQLESNTISQLHLNPDHIEFIAQKELTNTEMVYVIAEIEYDANNEFIEDDYGLTSHICIVNTITGDVKSHISETSKQNGWVSDAIFISEIKIDPNNYKLKEATKTFGVQVMYRNSSQPNPYSATELSLYNIEDKGISKVLDGLVISQYSGEVNVYMDTCNSDLISKKSDVVTLDSNTDGYFYVQINTTISNITSETNSEGDCNPIVKSVEKKMSILKYANAQYQ